MSNAFNRRLTHRCTIQRASQSTNALNETVETFSAQATQVPCRYVEKQERVFSNERGEWLTLPVKLLLFKAEQEVQAKDRFTTITLEDGSEIPGTFMVEGDLLQRGGRISRHHLSVKLRKLAG